METMLSLSIVWTVTVFMSCTGFVRTDTIQDGYSGEVGTLFNKLLMEDFIKYNGPVSEADKKMEQFTHRPYDTQRAIALINLYTQETDFYKTLNREMRSGNPTGIWRTAGYLMNRGLDILQPTFHALTYRGCSKLDTLPKAGYEYRFNQFTSTSLSKETGEGFAQCGFLFILKNVYGVSIEEYSDLSFEREILLKSTEVFRVTKGPIPEGKYQSYELDGRRNNVGAVMSGSKKAANVNMNTFSVLVVLIFLFY